MFLLTDGIVEARSPADEMFGLPRVREVAMAHRDRSAEDALHALVEAAVDFHGGRPQQDDMTAVVVKVGA